MSFSGEEKFTPFLPLPLPVARSCALPWARWAFSRPLTSTTSGGCAVGVLCVRVCVLSVLRTHVCVCMRVYVCLHLVEVQGPAQGHCCVVSMCSCGALTLATAHSPHPDIRSLPTSCKSRLPPGRASRGSWRPTACRCTAHSAPASAARWGHTPGQLRVGHQPQQTLPERLERAAYTLACPICATAFMLMSSRVCTTRCMTQPASRRASSTCSTTPSSTGEKQLPVTSVRSTDCRPHWRPAGQAATG